MLQQDDIKQAVNKYRNVILEATRDAAKAELPQPLHVNFSTSSITTESAKALSQIIPTGGRIEDKGSEFIYIFTIDDGCDVALNTVYEAFNNERNIQRREDYTGKKNLCKPNPYSDDSRAIYVGRSYKPRERFKQHLLASRGGTYAVHFQAWSQDIDLNVNFYCYQFRNLGDHVVQVIEDGLWDHIKPLLGKRGER